MEGIDKDHIMFDYDHGPMVMGRGWASISFLTVVFPCLPSGSTSAIIWRFTPGKIDKAQRAFANLGPTPWLCINFVKNPDQIEEYQSYCKYTFRKLSISNIIQAVDRSSDLKFDVSYSCFLIQRQGDNNIKPDELGYLQHHIVEPITSHIKQELKFKLMEAEHEAWLQVYKSFETVPELRQVAGCYVLSGMSIFCKMITVSFEQN